MNDKRPLRAVLMETFSTNGSTYNKGEIYDIDKFVTMDDKAMVFITDGHKGCLVTPATIQILAPETKKKSTQKRKKWQKKKRVS